MLSPSRPAGSAWPAVIAAFAYGLIEWIALSRSRAIDRLAVWRRQLSRQ